MSFKDVRHTYELSDFRVQRSRGRRKCTECGDVIPKDDLCLKAWLADRCPHYKKVGSRPVTFFAHKTIQLCLSCVDHGVPQRVHETYTRAQHKQRILESVLSDLKEFRVNPEKYPYV